MNTETTNTNESSGIGPQMNRRQMIKTVGAAGGVAAVGSGAVADSPVSPTGSASALPDIAEALGPTTAFGGLQLVKNWLDGSADVDEDLNTETYVYQLANTIADLRSGPTGDRSEIRREFDDPPQGQSAYAEAAGDTVVSTAAKKTFEGEGSSAENAAQQALSEQTTRSLVNIIEMWNASILRMIESGAFVEDVEQGTGVIQDTRDSGTTLDAVSEDTYPEWTPIEDTSPEGESGYICFKQTVPAADLPSDPTNLDGREEPLTVYSLVMSDGTSSTMWLP